MKTEDVTLLWSPSTTECFTILPLQLITVTASKEEAAAAALVEAAAAASGGPRRRRRQRPIPSSSSPRRKKKPSWLEVAASENAVKIMSAKTTILTVAMLPMTIMILL